jgi:NTE family protein
MGSVVLDASAILELPLFAGLTPADLAGLDAHLAAEGHARGTYLFRRGDIGDALYVVVSGQVALELPGATAVEVLSLCGPGDWFGELALLSGGPRTADARVTVDATLLRVSRTGWSVLSVRAPQLFARLCERLSAHLRATNDRHRPARRTVIACDGNSASWFATLVGSLRRQFPGRDVHAVDADDPGALARTLAAIRAPDALVLLAGAASDGLADRRLERRGPCEWTLAPGRAGRAREVIRGVTLEATLDRVARHVAGGTIGLALGAGGAYGFAHLGVLRALERAAIPVDCVAGASMGAIVGAGLAAGASAERLIAFAAEVSARYRAIVLRDVDLRGSALLRGTGIMRVLGALEELGHATFEELLLPFVAVAMDVGTGEEVVLESGPLLEGIQPSFAMPGIFPPVSRDARLMVDGAMVNPVPVGRARALGADFVIAAQPIPPLQAAAERAGTGVLARLRRLTDLLPLGAVRGKLDTLDVTVRSFQSLWYQLATVGALAADAVVRPELEDFWFLGFGDAVPIIAAGENAATAGVERIRSELAARVGWVGSSRADAI